MKIETAKTAGFCFGVRRAAECVYNALEKGKTATLGELIHNADFVNELKEKGVRVINSPSEAENETVVIRSHGVPDSVFEELEERGIPYKDGTCPFVKKIHDIARRETEAGSTVIIMGDKEHPEIIGAAGSCRIPPVILPDEKALSEYLLKNFENSAKTVAILAQTTYNIDKWTLCAEIARKYNNCRVYNTICRATSERQSEAAGLAAMSDMVIVIGGRNSSNTMKLFEICRKICPHTFHIENAAELNKDELLKGFSDISGIRAGITAGASVPAHIIKEVYNQMSEILQNNDEDFNFEEAIDASLKRLHNGDRVKGYITAVNNAEALVDIGAKQTGCVSLSELTDDPSLKPADVVKVGEEVEFIVLKVNDAEGSVTLSKKKLDAKAGFDRIIAAKEENTVLDGVVTDVVKGGVLAVINGINGIKIFIPASQTGVRKDGKLDDLKKKDVKFKIIEVNEAKGKAVGSIRNASAAERDAAKEKFWSTVKVGDVFKGEVKSLTSYGAFVDLGGIDGMVHISELSWSRIKNPAEVVSVGDVLEVYVKDLDEEANRISLGYKKAEDDPFVKFTNEYSVGDVIEGKVVSITPFGAFVRIMPGIDGLVHISQLSDKRVANVKDVVAIGDEVKAKITEIEEEKKRISLSIRDLLLEGGADDGEE